MVPTVEPTNSKVRGRDAIDFSRRFMPERLTPLYHTPSYALLSPAQRLRYNQLHAAYFNEQTIFFESAMARLILQSFRTGELPSGLNEGLRTFIAEETRHSHLFRTLNRRCFPERYATSDFFFVHVSPLPATLLKTWVRNARRFPFFLWVLLIQEERALAFGGQFLDEADALEPNFVSAQRQHLADEAGHIAWDEELLDFTWPKRSAGWRDFNARCFAWMLREYFTTPKRSGLRVIAELLKQEPSLHAHWPAMRREMLQLEHNPAFQTLGYSRQITPKSFARFDRWPEFHRLAGILPGYRPHSDL